MAREAARQRAGLETAFYDRFVFKFGSKLVMGLVIVLVFLTVAQCTIEKPESPQFTTQFTVPVVNRTYDMEELIAKVDQDGLSIDGSDNVVYTISEDLDTVRLDADVLSTGDLSYSGGDSLGLVNVATPTVDPVNVALNSITGLASALPGDQAFVGSLSFDLYNRLDPLPGITSATFAAGDATVQIVNSLGVNLDTVIVSLWDVVHASVIDCDTLLNGLVNGQTGSMPLSLAGKTISDTLEIRVHCYTPGATVLSASTRSLQSSLAFSESLYVSSGVAETPAIALSFAQDVDLAESDRLTAATFSGGNLGLTMSNTSNLAADVTLTVPDIRLGANALVIDTVVPAQGILVVNHGLTGYTLTPSDVTTPQTVGLSASLNVRGSGATRVAVDQHHGVTVDAVLSSLSFASITGVFTAQEATFEDVSVDVDLPTGFDSLELVSAQLDLTVANGIELPGHLDIQLVANNGRTLDLVGDIDAATGSIPATSVVSSAEVAQFITPLPTSIEAVGSVTFGDGVTEATLDAGDFVFSSVEISAPIEAVIKETLIETDISSESIEQGDIDEITDNVIEASFRYQITSRLPVGTTVEVFLGGDSATLYSDPQVRIDPFGVVAAPQTGGVSRDTVTVGSIALTNEDVRVLENETLFVGQELYLLGSNGQPVRLTGSDYLIVSGAVVVDYHFDGDL